MKSAVGFIVDDQLQVVEFVGQTAPLIQLPDGAATLSLARLLSDSLQPIVLEAVNQARHTQAGVQRKGVKYYEDGVPRSAVLSVTPEGPNRWRVQLERQRKTPYRRPAARAPHSTEDLAVELEVANEELRASVNELVAANQEIRRSRTALRQSQAKLQERYNFIAAVLDPEGRIVEFNRACEVTTGISQEDACGVEIWAFLPLEQIAETKERFAALLTANSAESYENDWLSRDGTRHRIAWSYTTMRDAKGQVAYMIASGIDVTSRHQAENSLVASESRFRAVIENAAEGIIGIDPAGQILIANPAACRVFGYSQEELLQSKLSQLIPEVGRRSHAGHQQGYFELPSTRRIAPNSSLCGRRKDGSEVPLEISLRAISTPAGQLAVAFIQDITERVEHRRRLQSLAGRLLKAQEEERRRIARDIHDDLTQTISLLGMKLGFLKQEVNGTPEKLLAGIKDAQNQVDLIHDEVRAISHRLHPSTLEYSGLVPALESLVCETDKDDRPRVRLVVGKLPEDLPTAAASALYRIAQEALHNAKKSADANNVSIHLSSRKGNLHLVVIDDGRGFDLAHCRSLGGLGLISMEERARDLGGHFAVHSAPGSGTHIEVDVPLASHPS